MGCNFFIAISIFIISADLSINMIEKQPSILVELNDVAKGKSVNKTVFIRAHKVGDRNISIKVN